MGSEGNKRKESDMAEKNTEEPVQLKNQQPEKKERLSFAEYVVQWNQKKIEQWEKEGKL